MLGLFQKKPRVHVRITIRCVKNDEIWKIVADADKMSKLHPNVEIEVELPDV